jgi:ribulose-phosphate 3-epimerase
VPNPLILELGVKSDPIEYRYSWPWLFRILADEGVRHMQVGTFFEIYHLPDSYFIELRREAARFGVEISSVFTAHRELGGFFRGEPAWEQVAFENFRRLIRCGSLLGAQSVGSNPGAVMRDQMELKPAGIRCYVANMKQLMHYAHSCGVSTLAIEPMSCLAEPPTLPAEVEEIAEELLAYHHAKPGETATIGYCFDISHGYLDGNRQVQHSNTQMLLATLPYVTELHLKNTDKMLESTFGFTDAELQRGSVDVEQIRDLLLENAGLLPVDKLIGYLEIGGPKLGRDYTDCLLEERLRSSLRHLRRAFVHGESEKKPTPAVLVPAVPESSPPLEVMISASMMCADMGQLAEEIGQLERLGVSALHWDIMDAHFVPNMPCGLALLEQMRSRTSLPFDVHLMVEDNEFFIRELAKIGVQMISVHYESARHCDRTLSLIRECGAKAGVALNPATSLSALEYLTDLLDFVLVMTVNPGFAGQKLSKSGLQKIADCRAWLDDRGLNTSVEVDGNVSFEHIPAMVSAGADALVLGTSSLFHPGASRQANMRKTLDAIRSGTQTRTMRRAKPAPGPLGVRL